MSTDRNPGPAPTYDLRELGEERAIYERLDLLADRFPEMAAAEVGPAFARVEEFAARARLESGRDDKSYRRTTRERYLVELLACATAGRSVAVPSGEANRDCLTACAELAARRQSRYDIDGAHRRHSGGLDELAVARRCRPVTCRSWNAPHRMG